MRLRRPSRSADRFRAKHRTQHNHRDEPSVRTSTKNPKFRRTGLRRFGPCAYQQPEDPTHCRSYSTYTIPDSCCALFFGVRNGNLAVSSFFPKGLDEQSTPQKADTVPYRHPFERRDRFLDGFAGLRWKKKKKILVISGKLPLPPPSPLCRVRAMRFLLHRVCCSPLPSTNAIEHF